MESRAIDPVGFRKAQRRHWDSAAVGWKEWSEFNDTADAHISRRLVELADVQPGSWVLDVAAGYGEPALTAARHAGPQGRVVATDISAEMLAFGRERAAAAGLRNVEFIQADASSLDFPQASFDAAVSRWGIIFEPDAEAAAARIRSFLKPGARIAISSWGEPDQVPFLSIPIRTTMERLDVPPPPAGTPGPLSRPTPAAIGGLLESGGFSNVAVEQNEVTFKFDSPEQFTAYVRAISAPIRAMIEQHAGEAQEEA
jgi:SAM-dependent methyltransferase